MTTQITVRLPDHAVAFIDSEVRRGAGLSRAALVTAALEREENRVRAERDIALLADLGDYDFGTLGRPAPLDDLD